MGISNRRAKEKADYLFEGNGEKTLGKRNIGLVSLLVLLVMAFFFWLGTKECLKATSMAKVARREAQRINAVYLSESGIEWAKGCLKEDSLWLGGEKNFKCGQIEVIVEKNSEIFTVYSHASSGFAQHGVKAVLENCEEGFNMVNFEDVH